MTDPLRRLDLVDDVPAPDLWPRIAAGEPGPPGRHPRGRILAAVVGVVVAAAGIGFGVYALRAHPAAPEGPRPATVSVTRQDFGKAITLRVGDVLDIVLNRPIRRGQWVLNGYPKDLLRLTSVSRAAGRFVFHARTSGRGVIRISLVVNCGPPIVGSAAAPDALTAVHCPVGGGPGLKVPFEVLQLTVLVR